MKNLTVVFVVLLAVGCGKKSDYVGEWIGKAANGVAVDESLQTLAKKEPAEYVHVLLTKQFGSMQKKLELNANFKGWMEDMNGERYPIKWLERTSQIMVKRTDVEDGTVFYLLKRTDGTLFDRVKLQEASEGEPRVFRDFLYTRKAD